MPLTRRYAPPMLSKEWHASAWHDDTASLSFCTNRSLDFAVQHQDENVPMVGVRSRRCGYTRCHVTISNQPLELPLRVGADRHPHPLCFMGYRFRPLSLLPDNISTCATPWVNFMSMLGTTCPPVRPITKEGLLLAAKVSFPEN